MPIEPIERFLRILNACWSDVVADYSGMELQDRLNDWLQFHWEFIVESALSDDYSIVLEPYGEGAETKNLRVSDLRTSVTHRVCCRPKRGLELLEMIGQNRVEFPEDGLPLMEFVSCRKGDWLKVEPPFNAVQLYFPDSALQSLEEGLPLVFPLEDIDFVLLPL